MKTALTILLLLLSTIAAKAQDYSIYDTKFFDLRNNVKQVDVLYYDAEGNVVFDNNYSNYNRLEFNKAGQVLQTIKMISETDTVEKYVYRYNTMGKLIEHLTYKPLDEYYTQYGGLAETRKFYFNNTGLVVSEIKFGDDQEPYDSLSYSFDKENNLLRIYQHGDGSYSIFLNSYNQKNQRVGTIYYTAHPREPIQVNRWEYKGNETKVFNHIYEEKDLRKISQRIINDKGSNLDKQDIEKLKLDQGANYILSKSSLVDDLITHIKNEPGKGGSNRWSNKFTAAPQFITHYNSNQQEQKIVWPDYTIEFEYNKYGDLIKRTNSSVAGNQRNIIEYRYSYDAFNNWIERTEYIDSELSTRVVREITYH
jgi:hypothetical protein